MSESTDRTNPSSHRSRLLAQIAGLAAVCLILGFSASDWIAPWRPGQAYLSTHYPGNLRYRVSSSNSGKGGSRSCQELGYILIPESLKRFALIEVTLQEGRVAERWSTRLFPFTLLVHLLLWAGLVNFLRIAVGSAVKEPRGLGESRFVAAVRGLKHLQAGVETPRSEKRDFRLFMWYFAVIMVLFLVADYILVPLQLVFILGFVAVLVEKAREDRRKTGWKWGGIKKAHWLGIGVQSLWWIAVLWAAAGTVPLLSRQVFPWTMGVLGFAAYNFLGALGLLEPDTRGSDDTRAV